ncbi:MAG: helix-turn-helix domain-containing protein, partial [Polyangiales bacterium]
NPGEKSGIATFTQIGHHLCVMESKPGGRAMRGNRTAERVELFTASDVARFCQVDLKTIHNWADKGEIRHFRTPGRHLRFRRLDVLDFLRKYGYAIPEALRQTKPRVALVEGDPTTAATLKRLLVKRFEVSTFVDPFDALVAVAALQPDALVMDVEQPSSPGFDGVRFLARLHANEATAHIRLIVFTHREELRERSLAAGAVELVAKDDPARLRETLDRLMGTDR